MLPQITMHLIQRPCYQWGCPCQDPAGNQTTRRPPDHRKEMQTAVVWSCLLFIRSGRTILQGTVKGGRRQGRQRKRWEDNIREQTDLEFAKSQRTVENRGKRKKKLVAKLSVVPQRPSRLRERWWDDDEGLKTNVSLSQKLFCTDAWQEGTIKTNKQNVTIERWRLTW